MRAELYEESAQKVIDKTEYCGPHCDHRILHNPLNCESCSMPEWDDLHKLRSEMKVRYTGQSQINDWDSNGEYIPCPSEMKRALEDIYKWPRNRPSL